MFENCSTWACKDLDRSRGNTKRNIYRKKYMRNYSKRRHRIERKIQDEIARRKRKGGQGKIYQIFNIANVFTKEGRRIVARWVKPRS